MQPRIVDVSLDEETGEIQGPQDYLDPASAVLAEFRRLPDDAEIGFVDVRAGIQFWKRDRTRILVNDALWHGRCHGSHYCSFEVGDSAPLIVVLFGNNAAITYNGRYNNQIFVFEPDELNDDFYDIDIELIGTRGNRVLVHQIYLFSLTIRPQLSLEIRQPGANGGQPELAARIPDTPPVN